MSVDRVGGGAGSMRSIENVGRVIHYFDYTTRASLRPVFPAPHNHYDFSSAACNEPRGCARGARKQTSVDLHSRLNLRRDGRRGDRRPS